MPLLTCYLPHTVSQPRIFFYQKAAHGINTPDRLDYLPLLPNVCCRPSLTLHKTYNNGRKSYHLADCLSSITVSQAVCSLVPRWARKKNSNPCPVGSLSSLLVLASDVFLTNSVIAERTGLLIAPFATFVLDCAHWL